MSSTLVRSVPVEVGRQSAKWPGTRDPVRGLPQALIYRPARHPRQSAPRPQYWLLEFEPSMAPRLEALMGWVSSDDALRSVKLRFPDRDSAVAFAEKHGWRYQLLPSEQKSAKGDAAPRRAPDEKGTPDNSHPTGSYDPVEEAGLESFPCSDPPAWAGGTGEPHQTVRA